MQTPSSKVGIALISVVLIVAGTIFYTKLPKKLEVKDLKNVDLVISRNTSSINKSGDGDNDGLLDWQEELYGTDPKNPDTDGDGTTDGNEIAAGRDPKVAGPHDKLMKPSDYFQSEADYKHVATGTVSDEMSIDLFTQYLGLKQKGSVTPQQTQDLTHSISEKVVKESGLKNHFSAFDLHTVMSNNVSLKAYGDDFAQISIKYLTEMDSYQNLADAKYFVAMSQTYKNFSTEMTQLNVPTTTLDMQLSIVNQLYNAGEVLDALADSDKDPTSALIVTGQYKKIEEAQAGIYTSLAQYFKNNGILFDNESTIKFWNYFEK